MYSLQIILRKMKNVNKTHVILEKIPILDARGSSLLLLGNYPLEFS